MKELTNEQKLRVLDETIKYLKLTIKTGETFNCNVGCCNMIDTSITELLNTNVYYKLNLVFPEAVEYIVKIGRKLNNTDYTFESEYWSIPGTFKERQQFRLKKMLYFRNKLKKEFGL